MDVESLEPVYKTVPAIHMAQAVHLKTLLQHSRDGRERATQQYECVLRVQPMNALAWAELGDLCVLQNKERAKYCFHKALALCPNNADVLYKYGKFLLHCGKKDLARDCWRRALEEHPCHEQSKMCLERWK